MPQILLSLPLFYEKYKTWVHDNPRKASDLETTLKWTSYFVAGRIRNSHTVSELVYCLSNLLVLYNDRIISGFQRIGFPPAGDILKVWLTVLEYSEVFFELSAKSVWGTTGKWFIIVIVQLFKCICRLLLIYHYKEAITESPPITPLIRKDAYSFGSLRNNDFKQAELESISFTLTRSGKVLRRVDASPAIHDRTWKAIELPEVKETVASSQDRVKLVAETIYVCKPLVHLGTMACFGSNRWKPWMLALALDLLSLKLYEQGNKHNAKLSPNQKLQISRRYVTLVMYLLRSPFYDQYSKKRIEMFLNSFGKNIPLARYITNPISKYLPFWQSIYFYMWSN